MKTLPWLLLAALVASPAAAQTVNLSSEAGVCLQYTGGKLNVANVSGCSAALVGAIGPSALPSATTTQVYVGTGAAGAAGVSGLGALFDVLFGNTVGGVQMRGPSAWTNSGYGALGYVLTGNGSGASPSWQPPSSSGTPTPRSASGSTDTISTADAGRTVVYNSSSTTTTTVGDPGLAVSVGLYNIGTGVVNLVNGSGVVLKAVGGATFTSPSPQLPAQGAYATVEGTGAGTVFVYGSYQ